MSNVWTYIGEALAAIEAKSPFVYDYDLRALTYAGEFRADHIYGETITAGSGGIASGASIKSAGSGEFFNSDPYTPTVNARMAPAQTADAQVWQSSSGMDIARIDPTGRINAQSVTLAGDINADGVLNAYKGQFVNGVDAEGYSWFRNNVHLSRLRSMDQSVGLDFSDNVGVDVFGRLRPRNGMVVSGSPSGSSTGVEITSPIDGDALRLYGDWFQGITMYPGKRTYTNLVISDPQSGVLTLAHYGTGDLRLKGANESVVPLRVDGAPGQYAPIFEGYNSSGQRNVHIYADGTIAGVQLFSEVVAVNSKNMLLRNHGGTPAIEFQGSSDLATAQAVNGRIEMSYGTGMFHLLSADRQSHRGLYLRDIIAEYGVAAKEFNLPADLEFGYKPKWVVDTTNHVMDLDYNGQAIGTRNDTPGGMFRYDLRSGGTFDVYGKPGDGTGVDRILTVPFVKGGQMQVKRWLSLNVPNEAPIAMDISVGDGYNSIFRIEKNGSVGMNRAGSGNRAMLDVAIASGAPGLLLQSAPGQNADLTQWLNSSGEVLARVDLYGRYYGHSFHGTSGGQNSPAFEARNTAAGGSNALWQGYDQDGVTLTSKIGRQGDFYANTWRHPADVSLGFQLHAGARIDILAPQVWMLPGSYFFMRSPNGQRAANFGLLDDGTFNAAVNPSVQSWEDADSVMLGNKSPGQSQRSAIRASGAVEAFVHVGNGRAGHGAVTPLTVYHDGDQAGLSGPPTGDLLLAYQGTSKKFGVSKMGGVEVKGSPGQTDPLQTWSSSSGTPLLRVWPSGYLNARSGIDMEGSSVNNADAVTTRVMYAQSPTIDRIVSAISGPAGLTSDLTQWKKGGVVLAAINSSGHLEGRNKDLLLRQSGDSYGSTYLALRNREGANGAVFGNDGLDLVDFAFRPNSGAQGNIRFEHRSSYVSGNPGGEFQFIENAVFFRTGRVETVVAEGKLKVQQGSVEVKGAAGQTADLQTWKNSSDQVLARVRSDGSIESKGVILEKNSTVAVMPIPGRYTATPGSFTGDGNVGAAVNLLTLNRYPLGRATTFDRMASNVTAAGQTGSVLRFGIYAEGADGVSLNLVLDAGTVDSTSTGDKFVTIAQTLAAGPYWIGMVVQGAAAGVRVFTENNRTAAGMLGQNSPAPFHGQSCGTPQWAGVSGALPATLSLTAAAWPTNGYYVPSVWLRANT